MTRVLEVRLQLNRLLLMTVFALHIPCMQLLSYLAEQKGVIKDFHRSQCKLDLGYHSNVKYANEQSLCGEQKIGSESHLSFSCVIAYTVSKQI